MILNLIFFLIGCLVSSVATYLIVNKIYQKTIDRITNKNEFAESLAKGQLPDWTTLNNVPCEAIDTCHDKVSNILYQKHFADEIDFIVLEKFLQDTKRFIACDNKESLIRSLLIEAAIKIDVEKLANSIADFIENGGSGKDAENTINLFSVVLQELREQSYLDFLHLLDSRVDRLIFEAKSQEERNRILNITFRIK